jgi:predicted nuclease of predicted toxin-antitoxin system
LRFLLDVNVGTTVADALSGDGHDVERVGLITPREQDENILEWAVREKRVLVSHDSDFTDLIFRDRRPAPPAVLYIRFERADVEVLAARIVELVRGGSIDHCIVVIGPYETRRRPFPGREEND